MSNSTGMTSDAPQTPAEATNSTMVQFVWNGVHARSEAELRDARDENFDGVDDRWKTLLSSG